MGKIHWSGGSADLRIGCERERGNRFGSIQHRSWPASAFAERAAASPDHYCAHCTKAARLALAKEQPIAVSFSSTVRRCTRCRSGAINPSDHGRTDGVDLDLCDVCYWRKRAESAAKADTRTDSDRYAELRSLVEADLDLCDVCYWRKRAQPEPRPIAEASYPSRVLAWFPSLSGWRIVRAGCWPVHESNGYHLPTHFLPLPPSPEVT